MIQQASKRGSGENKVTNDEPHPAVPYRIPVTSGPRPGTRDSEQVVLCTRQHQSIRTGSVLTRIAVIKQAGESETYGPHPVLTIKVCCTGISILERERGLPPNRY